jgi:uncharacterized protein (DUF305 family)
MQTQSKSKPSMEHNASGSEAHHYAMFGAMILTSAVVMFVVGYLNVYQIDHIFFSQTRAYMAVIMASAMAIVMLAFMRKMLTNTRKNLIVVVAAAISFIAATLLMRSQATVGDIAYMEAMIPHHSIAILTSNRANITDPQVRKLADKIIESQQTEIAEMKALIQNLRNK